MRKLSDSGADEDEAHKETGEWNPPEESERGERIEYRADESEDHQERMLAPTYVEQTTHGGPEASEVFLDHVDFKRRDRKKESRKNAFRCQRPTEIREAPQCKGSDAGAPDE